ncbi:MAG: multidrug resistance efflux pump [Hyphomicrobiaceae bacterium]
MAKTKRTMTDQLRAASDVFDRLGARPLGLVGFALSATALIYLSGLTTVAIHAEAVGAARAVEHPAMVASFVTQVFVNPGDRVMAGAPLADLSSRFIDQRIAELDAEVAQLIEESRLAQAKLFVTEERWVTPSTRVRPDRPSLKGPTEALYAKQIEAVQGRRQRLLADRQELTIVSGVDGVIASVARLGASIGEGASVAAIVPEFAQEIVAFVPATTDPATISPGSRAFISSPTSTTACRGVGEVLRRGAVVEAAPGQLRGVFSSTVHGLPVHISVPPDCELGIGQVVTVDLRPRLS